MDANGMMRPGSFRWLIRSLRLNAGVERPPLVEPRRSDMGKALDRARVELAAIDEQLARFKGADGRASIIQAALVKAVDELASIGSMLEGGG